MSAHSTFRLAPGLILLPLGIALTGCTNLKPISDFAAISTEGQTLESVAAELADSPTRHLRYTTNEMAKGDLAFSAALGRTNQQSLVAAHAIIQSYMATLGTLASDGIVASNNALAGLNKELATAKLFAGQAETRDAFGKLAELVSKAATDFYRRAKLHDMIQQGSNSFPLAITALQRVVTNDCVIILQSELGDLNQYYIERSGILDTNTPSWAVVLVEEIRQDRQTALKNRIRVCQQYGIILGKIADGYAAMLKNLDHLDAKELVSILGGYEQEISAAYDSFAKLK